jgi:hypothetical protein
MNSILKVICACLLFVPSGAYAQPPKIFIGQQKDMIESYVKNIGTPDGFMVYTSIQDVSGLSAPSDKGAGIQHAQYYVAHYPKADIQLAVYMKAALEDVLLGRYDTNIQKLGAWIKRSKRTVYLRIGYEFDLPDNQYSSYVYAQAFRYMVVHLRAQRVNNVYYVWHSAASRTSAGNFLDWYPGDDVVDWFAVSWFDSQQLQTVEAFYNLAKAHDKPFMIAESTPAGMYSVQGKKYWYKKYFGFIRTHDVPIVSYINSNWDDLPMFKHMSWGDARIEKDNDIKEMWLKFLAK